MTSQETTLGELVIKKILATAAITGALLVGGATPALAHSDSNYCGHSATGYWHLYYWVYSWNSGGHHYHSVSVAHGYWDGTLDYDTVHCHHYPYGH